MFTSDAELARELQRLRDELQRERQRTKALETRAEMLEEAARRAYRYSLAPRTDAERQRRVTPVSGGC